jgi:hypothetical protein
MTAGSLTLRNTMPPKPDLIAGPMNAKFVYRVSVTSALHVY